MDTYIKVENIEITNRQSGMVLIGNETISGTYGYSMGVEKSFYKMNYYDSVFCGRKEKFYTLKEVRQNLKQCKEIWDKYYANKYKGGTHA